MFDSEAFLAHLTTEPGIYRMLDTGGVVLYVGKAANLKKRVGSYFTKQSKSAKTSALVSQIASVDVSITRSETEALLLESSLIKALRPKYNVLMRDDKSYPYIRISQKHPFPSIELVRCKTPPKGSGFFGPYPSVTAVRETLQLIQKVFKIRNCTDSYFNSRQRPCLQYQIQRCSAPCTDYISQSEYLQSVEDVTRFLQGKSQEILDELAERMEQAVGRLAFEEAARMRDHIKNLRLVQEGQGIMHLHGDVDVVAIDARRGFACIQCVTVREGQVLDNSSFFPSVPKQELVETEDSDSLWQQVFEAFVAHYYIDVPSRIPRVLITNEAPSDKKIWEELLSAERGTLCRIKVRPRGAMANWLDFALNNLQRTLAEHASSSKRMQEKYQALRDFLHLSAPIQRMECFDISHTQGDSTVASCVVFNGEGPSPRDYRRFNIEGITKGDDFAAMEQVLERRFQRLLQEARLPDVVIIDGGKGQVAVARRVFLALKIEGVALLGIAKGPTRKAGFERLILANEEGEIVLPSDSPALHLLQQIRDEAHRFAITAHRKKRHKRSLDSSLETIEGIGAKRRQALLRRFGGLRELCKAPVEEIAKVSGISRNLALRIYQHFH